MESSSQRWLGSASNVNLLSVDAQAMSRRVAEMSHHARIITFFAAILFFACYVWINPANVVTATAISKQVASPSAELTYEELLVSTLSNDAN